MSTISRKAVAKYIAQAWVEKTVPRSDLVKQMAAYLIDSKQTNQIDLLVNDIKVQIEEQYGVVVADVVSARELGDSLKHHIADFIKDETKAKKVMLNSSIDESLIGGFVATTPSAEFDHSIRAKLNQLKV